MLLDCVWLLPSLAVIMNFQLQEILMIFCCFLTTHLQRTKKMYSQTAQDHSLVKCNHTPWSQLWTGSAAAYLPLLYKELLENKHIWRHYSVCCSPSLVAHFVIFYVGLATTYYDMKPPFRKTLIRDIKFLLLVYLIIHKILKSLMH